MVNDVESLTTQRKLYLKMYALSEGTFNVVGVEEILTKNPNQNHCKKHVVHSIFFSQICDDRRTQII